MRILHVINSLKRKGPVNVLYNQIKYNRKDGHEIVIIAISDAENQSRFQEFQDLGVKIINLHLGYYSYYKLSKRIKQHVEEFHPDIVQANCFFSEWAISKLAFKNKISVIHNYPRDDFRYKFGPVVGPIMEYLSYRNRKKYKYLTTVSQANSIAYKQIYKLNTHHIFNGIELLESNCDSKVRNSLRKMLRINEDAVVIIYADSMIKRKDPETSIKGFLQFNKKNKNSVLLMAGSGKLLNELKEKYNSQDSVIFLGQVDNIIAYYSISNYFLTSSLAESFHLSVLEALLMNLPVICSDIPCHRFFVDLKENIGFLFKRGDYKSLSIALMKARKLKVNEPLINKKLIEEKKLTAELMASEYIKFYKDIVCGKL